MYSPHSSIQIDCGPSGELARQGLVHSYVASCVLEYQCTLFAAALQEPCDAVAIYV